MLLVNLVPSMYKEMSPDINEFQSVNTLVHLVNSTENFLALGMFNGEELVGFTMGNSLGSGKFYFSGIYIDKKFRRYSKELIDFSFDFIRKAGYTGWQLDATNPNIGSIMEKYGAKTMYVKYFKEFE